jgi:pyridoxal phosphate enzyme (YggS family)
MNIASRLEKLKNETGKNVTLVAVSKTKPANVVLQAYEAGQRIFGENKVQELCDKYEQLPKDIEWHLIGHLQTNKVKYVAPFVALIHAVDSMKLLKEINKEAAKNNRVQECLLQVFIATEETKFGLDFSEAEFLLASKELTDMPNIRIRGLMGMATFTDDEEQVRREFRSLKIFFDKMKTTASQDFNILSMGMSGDYKIAIEEGSSMIRVGSSIFGERQA